MIDPSDIDQLIYDPSPETLRAELVRIGINQGEAATLLRVDDRTFRRYLQRVGEGQTPIPFPHFALLKLMAPVVR